jgi:hypothetical protein
MKTPKMEFVDALKEKYKIRLARASQELKSDERRMRGQCSYISDLLLFWKWAYRVGKGWYGFNLGHIPPVWTDMLHDFLTQLESQCPDFQIQQIKMKLGSIRIYVDTRSNNQALNKAVQAECWKLTNLLRTPQNLKNAIANRPLHQTRKKHQKTPRAK